MQEDQIPEARALRAARNREKLLELPPQDRSAVEAFLSCLHRKGESGAIMMECLETFRAHYPKASRSEIDISAAAHKYLLDGGLMEPTDVNQYALNKETPLCSHVTYRLTDAGKDMIQMSGKASPALKGIHASRTGVLPR